LDAERVDLVQHCWPINMDLPVFVSDQTMIREEFKLKFIDLEIDFEEGGHEIAYDIIPYIR
jgi:hypothetical protein